MRLNGTSAAPARISSTVMNITVYGADWCPDTQRTRQYLDGLGVAYDYVDIDGDPEGEQTVIAANDGSRRIPLVDLQYAGERRILRVPSTEELCMAVERARDAA